MFEQAVAPEVLSLIEALSKKPDIAQRFYVAGGTALALHLGHRLSYDLDLFTQKSFRPERFLLDFSRMGGRILEATEGTLIAYINDTKVSLFEYPYKLLSPLIKFKGLNFASVEDIACMKVIAITQRGEKKDFYDLYEILKHYKIEEIKSLMLEKYPLELLNWYHIVKSLCYFDDAEKQTDPVSLNNTEWKNVKKFFLSREKEFSRVFLDI